VPPEHQLLSGTAVTIVGLGDHRVHTAAVDAAAAALDPLFRAVLPISYVALQQAFDPLPGIRSWSAHVRLPELTADVAQVLAERAALRSRHSRLTLLPLSGAISADAGHVVTIDGATLDPAADEAEQDWVRGTREALVGGRERR